MAGGPASPGGAAGRVVHHRDVGQRHVAAVDQQAAAQGRGCRPGCRRRVARPPAMARLCKTTERPDLVPTISKTRLVDSALMTELDSPCPTMVNVLLLRLEPLSMTSWPPVTA